MRIEINPAGLWKSIPMVAVWSVFVFTMQACKRPHTTGLEDEELEEVAEQASAEPGESKPNPAEPEPPKAESFVEPITGSPWLGHADDGVLVKVEFFANIEDGSTLCRTSVKNVFGRVANTKTPFSASSELTNITWDDGKSRGTFDPTSKVVTATVASRIGKHQVKLRQVTTESHPELKAPRKSIPDNEDSQAVHQKFAERLENGARWWKSIADWDKLVTPEGLVADGNYLVLIRPDSGVPIKVPELAAGDGFDIPLICHLPPGTELSADDETLGIVAELHHADSVRAMWVLSTLNPGAFVQDVTAHWAGGEAEAPLSGTCAIYIYLCKTGGGKVGSTNRMAMTNQPVSNLLKIDLEIAGGDKDAETEE